MAPKKSVPPRKTNDKDNKSARPKPDVVKLEATTQSNDQASASTEQARVQQNNKSHYGNVVTYGYHADGKFVFTIPEAAGKGKTIMFIVTLAGNQCFSEMVELVVKAFETKTQVYVEYSAGDNNTVVAIERIRAE